MTELLPCPLCASTNVSDGICFVGDRSTSEPAIRCADCGCRATLAAWTYRASEDGKCYGSTAVSKTVSAGSTPAPSAIPVCAQGATDTEYERELFAAITKIDLATAVSHIRNWTCYIDDYHRQKYADLIEAQAKLIAHLVNTRAPSLPEGMREEPWLVWSNEHEAWWRPERKGYTLDPRAAGLYSRDEAIAISWGVRKGWKFTRTDKIPDEIAVPLSSIPAENRPALSSTERA